MNFINSDITKCKFECFIIPSNGLGIMRKGVATKICKEGGPDISDSAREECFKHGLYKAGEAYETSSGFLIERGIKKIIHAVILTRPSDKVNIENCEKAIINSLKIVKENKFKNIALSSIGIESRKISDSDCAKMMIKVLKQYEKELNINIVDTNKSFINNCEKYYNA